MVMGCLSSLILFKYESSRGHLFGLSWARALRAAPVSAVSELCTVSGLASVTLLCCRPLQSQRWALRSQCGIC